MQERMLPNGNLRILKGTTGPGIRGHGYIEIGPDDPDYAPTLEWMERIGEPILPPEPDALTLFDLVHERLTREGNVEEVEALFSLLNNPNGLIQHYSKEMKSLTTQYEAVATMVKGALQKYKDEQFPSKNAPMSIQSRPAANTVEPKPKKGKKPKGK